jgi:photosystem I subunit 3
MAYESKQWSMAAIMGVTALVSVSVGATVGLVASNAAPTALYAPVAVQSTVGSTVATVPLSRQSMGIRAEPATAEPSVASEYVDQTVNEIPQQSFNWAPVAALIALPTAVAALLLRKADGQKAEDLEAPLMNAKLATAGLAASAVMASSAMLAPPAYAAQGVAGLVPCAESAKFQKNLKKEVKALEKREKLYEVGSAPYQALEATKARTQARFAKYAKQGLLCGDDGLPHLISDPGLAVRYGHAGETLIPTVGFLYVAGYIGTAGRTYLQEISSRQKPTQSEIIIDVPLAIKCSLSGFAWPLTAFKDIASGAMFAKDDEITVSPR